MHKKKTRRGHYIACCLAFIMANGLAQAAVINVDTTEDELNNDGDCSLREAVVAANTDSAVDTCTAGSGQDSIGQEMAELRPSYSGTSHKLNVKAIEIG
jgi:CSLREA domain-containing protein